MELVEKKINNVKVERIPDSDNHVRFDNQMFGTPFPVVYLLAKRNTGKTTLIYNILKECADPKTIVIMFSGTIYGRDYSGIRKMLNSKNVGHRSYNSFYIDVDGKKKNRLDRLKELTDYLKPRNMDPPEVIDPLGVDEEFANTEVEEPDLPITNFGHHKIMESLKSEDGEIPLHVDWKYIIVIDDLKEEIQHSPSLAAFMTKSRHVNAMTIISTQNKHHMTPTNTTQFTHVMVGNGTPFNGTSCELKELYKDISLRVGYPEFAELYERATAPNIGETKSRNFFYVDVDNNKFRKNFDIEYNLNTLQKKDAT